MSESSKHETPSVEELAKEKNDNLPPPPAGATCALIQRGNVGDAQDADIGLGDGADWLTGNMGYSWTGVSPLDHWSAYKFDLSPVPAGANVVLGVFSTYVQYNDSPATVRAHRIQNAWDESSVTWRNFTHNGTTNNWDPQVLGTFDGGDVGYRSIDVTGLVQGWASGAVANNGLLLEEDPVLLRTYFTSEANPANIRPSLYVCWTDGGQGCKQNGQACSGLADCCDGSYCNDGVCAPVGPPDGDGDGVPSNSDCDDANPLIGALLYQNDMSVDTSYLQNSPKLLDPWVYHDGAVSPTQGGQQALLGQAEVWTNTVTFATLSAHGSLSGCSGDAPDCHPDRFRAGILARQNIDLDQDEGYHGYRCAIAQNSATDCYEPGPFVQVAAFLDGPEDNIHSECTAGCPPNPTFDQLGRTNRSEHTNLLAGDSANLTFWVVGSSLLCEFDGLNGEHVSTAATDDRFNSGGTGLSTLNALGDFDQIKVCQAFGVPNGGGSGGSGGAGGSTSTGTGTGNGGAGGSTDTGTTTSTGNGGAGGSTDTGTTTTTVTDTNTDTGSGGAGGSTTTSTDSGTTSTVTGTGTDSGTTTTPACFPVGQTCGDDAFCCSGTCWDGMCIDMAACVEPDSVDANGNPNMCDVNAPCCGSGQHCISGSCFNDWLCSAPGGSCDEFSGVFCCWGLTCDKGTCVQ
ncbi:MAG: DNRLRE domain-containing protein [Polyangiaceae bacterium]